MKIIFIVKNQSGYENLLKLAEELEYEVVGLVAYTEAHFFSNVNGYPLYPQEYAYKLNYDLALLAGTDDYVDTFAKNVFPEIPREKFASVYWLLKQKMSLKYEDSKDPIIQETLEYWKTHSLSVFNQHLENFQDTWDEVFTDEENGFPYIWFETIGGQKRKMYYPHNGDFREKDGKTFVKNILQEQAPQSPHLYITDEHKIDEGDILIDAGVCEGNFALRYVEVCSRIYLFESDAKWLEPLYHTFRDYTDKVILIPKYVSNFSQGNNIALDDIVKIPDGSKVFLKMDIEGAEVDALHGAKNIFRRNKVKASVCSYHQPDDVWKIKSVLKRYGCKTWTSNGYMVFF